MTHAMTDTLSALIDLVYEGPVEATPWQAFAEGLRVAMDARNVVITLHHVTGQGSDTYVMAGIPGDPIDWASVEVTYRARFMADDPFSPAQMTPGQLVVLDDLASDRQRVFSKDLDIGPSLRICCAEPGGVRCWMDVVRSRKPQVISFSPEDIALVRTLIPHLSRALGLYARLQREAAEKVIYEGMVEHFGLGCVLLNEAGEVIHINRAAADVLERQPRIALRRGRLTLSDRTAQRALDTAMDAIIATREREDAVHDGELVRLDHGDGRLLALLVHPAPLLHYYRGSQAPCVIVYLADPTAGLEALRPEKAQALGRIGQLFGLTRQEASLALLLAYGHSIAEAAREMGIAETAARNYSKKIYSKLGITSQTQLVRLVLRSLSFLR